LCSAHRTGAPRTSYSKIEPRLLLASKRDRHFGSARDEVLTDIARQARSLLENVNESNVKPIGQPILEN